MPLPTLEKTYQYARASAISTINNRLVTTGSGSNDQKTILLRIVNDLIGFTNGWTVVGSSDSVASGMAGINRWAAIANLVFVTSGGTAHSWIVLSNATVQICLDCTSPFGGSGVNAAFMNVMMSVNAGFTGGSITARPTATDEVQVLPVTTNVNFLDGAGSSTPTARDYITSVVMSNDKEITRVMIRIPNSRYSVNFFVEKVKNPVSGWTYPWIARWGAMASGNATSYGNCNDVVSVTGLSPGGVMHMHQSSEGYISSMVGELLSTPNEISNSWEMFPVGLVCATVGFRGFHGRRFDTYWVLDAHQDGDTFPGDGTRTWLVIGDQVIPWNGSTPLLS